MEGTNASISFANNLAPEDPQRADLFTFLLEFDRFDALSPMRISGTHSLPSRC